MMRRHIAAACTAFTVVALATGCHSVQVLKDPGPQSTGIRYYRPKPYLLVSPADPTGRLIKLKLEYLPDFSEEYAIKPTKKTKVVLKDGWNLVAVNADAPPPSPPIETAAAAPPPADGALPPVVVAASNVPMGFYESILEPVNGKKVFRGWRYVGFSVLGGGTAPGNPELPICGQNPCPHGPNGACRNPEMPQPLYGLVSVNGVMTFREVGEIAMNNGCPFYVETPKPEAPAPAPPPVSGSGGVGGDTSGGGRVGEEPAVPQAGSGPLGDPPAPPTDAAPLPDTLAPPSPSLPPPASPSASASAAQPTPPAPVGVAEDLNLPPLPPDLAPAAPVAAAATIPALTPTPAGRPDPVVVPASGSKKGGGYDYLYDAKYRGGE